MTEYLPTGTQPLACHVDGCKDNPKARGLCGKHYQRYLRHADVDVTGKPGRPKDPWTLAAEQVGLANVMSARSLARWRRAMAVLKDVSDAGYDAVKPAITAATRPNGTLNVSELERIADAALMRWVVDTSD